MVATLNEIEIFVVVLIMSIKSWKMQKICICLQREQDKPVNDISECSKLNIKAGM